MELSVHSPSLRLNFLLDLYIPDRCEVRFMDEQGAALDTLFFFAILIENDFQFQKESP